MARHDGNGDKALPPSRSWRGTWASSRRRWKSRTSLHTRDDRWSNFVQRVRDERRSRRRSLTRRGSYPGGEGLAASAAARHGEREANCSISRVFGNVCRLSDTIRRGSHRVDHIEWVTPKRWGSAKPTWGGGKIEPPRLFVWLGGRAAIAPPSHAGAHSVSRIAGFRESGRSLCSQRAG